MDVFEKYSPQFQYFPDISHIHLGVIGIVFRHSRIRSLLVISHYPIKTNHIDSNRVYVNIYIHIYVYIYITCWLYSSIFYHTILMMVSKISPLYHSHWKWISGSDIIRRNAPSPLRPRCVTSVAGFGRSGFLLDAAVAQAEHRGDHRRPLWVASLGAPGAR